VTVSIGEPVRLAQNASAEEITRLLESRVAFLASNAGPKRGG
jgi:hypothetical protein